MNLDQFTQLIDIVQSFVDPEMLDDEAIPIPVGKKSKVMEVEEVDEDEDDGRNLS